MSARTPYEDLIYFVSCALNGVPADSKRAEETDLAALYKAAQRHMLTSLAAAGLESAGVHDEAFTQAKNKAARKAVLLDADKALVLESLEKAGIWYMPLKGSVIKDLYPFTGARQMADCDVLIDASRAEDVRDVMTGLGFEIRGFGTGAHDSYTRPPVSNFEMHRKLFASSAGKKLAAYYADAESRLIPDAEGSFGRHFSDEDLYVYLTAHEYKHYSHSGTGLRSLADNYVLAKAKAGSLDWEYVRKELEKLGISEFEEQARGLALRLFSGGELSEEDRSVLDYVTKSGTYGTVRNGVDNGVRELGGGFWGRVKYFFKRAILPMETVRGGFPLFARYPVLLPFLPFYRVYKSLTGEKKIKSELKALFANKEKKSS